MSATQLTRLADFTGGAGFMVIVFAILTSPRWWLVVAALLLMIIASVFALHPISPRAVKKIKLTHYPQAAGRVRSSLMPHREPVQVRRVDQCDTLHELITHCFPASGGAFLRRVYTILDLAIGMGCPLTLAIAPPV